MCELTVGPPFTTSPHLGSWLRRGSSVRLEMELQSCSLSSMGGPQTVLNSFPPGLHLGLPVVPGHFTKEKIGKEGNLSCKGQGRT
jgi:hypothetical protein